ncbi:MAG: phosphoribosylaminoimidazolesuccinocarboxamide synthase [Pseudomonadota bacterium]
MSAEAPGACVYDSDIDGLEMIARGKVRDIYAVDDERLLIVVSDRLSAFDVVLPDPIPGKGTILTGISNFWFEHTRSIVANHLHGATELEEVLAAVDALHYAPRSMLVRRLRPLPIEAVVRGYLLGSGWVDYQATGEVCGIPLAPGLRQAEQLAAPLFTPATKAAIGDHDENISFAECAKLIGETTAARVRDTSIALYQYAARYAAERGIIIADTKFEFALDGDELILIDEALTPDSSRFWPADAYAVDTSPPSFDKQYVRDYLATLDWDRSAPGPSLPGHVIDGTVERYRRALTLLTGP